MGDFHSSLIPGPAREKNHWNPCALAMRKLAKEFGERTGGGCVFKTAPHTYYDENILHALLIAGMKDYDACMETLMGVLPYIDNWAVCDSVFPRKYSGNIKRSFWRKIRLWIPSSIPTFAGLEWACSCAGFWMRTFSRNIWRCLPRSVQEEYYVNMMTAWFFATALAKQWDAAISYLEQNRLDPWTHNKTIQKARESYRITPGQKEYLKTLKH